MKKVYAILKHRNEIQEKAERDQELYYIDEL